MFCYILLCLLKTLLIADFLSSISTKLFLRLYKTSFKINQASLNKVVLFVTDSNSESLKELETLKNEVSKYKKIIGQKNDELFKKDKLVSSTSVLTMCLLNLDKLVFCKFFEQGLSK